MRSNDSKEHKKFVNMFEARSLFKEKIKKSDSNDLIYVLRLILDRLVTNQNNSKSENLKDIEQLIGRFDKNVLILSLYDVARMIHTLNQRKFMKFHIPGHPISPNGDGYNQNPQDEDSQGDGGNDVFALGNWN